MTGVDEMYIKSIKIYGFGKHVNREFNFKSGLNVLYGDNEAGKSTLFAFIRSMFYGLTGRGEENYRKRYFPWDRFDGDGRAVRFGGEMVFESGGTYYHQVCIWGASKREDVCTLNEFYTGRVVKLAPGKSVGEQILRLTADAYDSSVYIGQLASAIKSGGDKDGVLLARLSAVSGFDGEEQTGTMVKQLLKDKMDALKAPRGKNGELDQLVIKKLNMQNELTRLSDVDNKVAARKESLDELFKERDRLLKKTAECERLLKMSRAAKLLLTKDKIMTVFASVDNICAELDECKAVAEKYNNEAPSLKRLIGGIVSGVAGAVLVALFFLIPGLSPAVKYSLLAGGGAMVLLAAILLAGRKKRSSYIVKNGNKIDVFQRIEELEETLSQKEVLIQSYLDGQTLEEFNEKWREAEQLLKTSTDEERRFCTSRPSAGFEETLAAIRKETEPVMEKIGYIQAEIDSLRASSNVSFSEAQEALNGIDEKINLLNDEYKAYALAYEVLEESITEMQTTLCPGLCSSTEKIFNAITGKNIKVKIAEDFSIMVSDDSIPRGINSYSGATVDQAYFALRIALSDMISPKDETYPIMMDDPFVQYDDSRMSNGVDFLCSYAKNAEQAGQIIYASCHKRVLDAVPDATVI